MSTRYIICSDKNITIYGDVFEEKNVYFKHNNLENFSILSENKNSFLEVIVDSKQLKNICELYIEYLEKNNKLAWCLTMKLS